MLVLAEDLKLCANLWGATCGWCVLQEVKGPIEDMFMWVDKRGGYHTLFHLMYGCSNCGSHAYSVRARHVPAVACRRLKTAVIMTYHSHPTLWSADSNCLLHGYIRMMGCTGPTLARRTTPSRTTVMVLRSPILTARSVKRPAGPVPSTLFQLHCILYTPYMIRLQFCVIE
jgi:hypothetical protein